MQISKTQLPIIFIISLLFYNISVQAQTPKVIIIGVDGLSVDGVQKAHTPNMDLMMKKGAYTLKAQAVMPTKSSPNWKSMLSGVGPKKHQVGSNGFSPATYQESPTCPNYPNQFPTIFTILKEQNPDATSALIYQWSAFIKLVNPSEINFTKNKLIRAEAVAKVAKKQLKNNVPVLTWLHFDLVDHKGHLRGYHHPSYYKTVERMDKMLPYFIKLADNDPNLTIMLVSDHGGILKNHGGGTPEEKTVPLIIYGQNIKAQIITKDVSNIDISPTIAHILKLEYHDCWDGQNILGPLDN